MRFKDPSVEQIRVGPNRVGIVGLRRALKKVTESDLSGREAIVDSLVKTLASENYIPGRERDLFRTALRREYLRFKGEDFSEFYSEIEVTIRGDAGEERDRTVELLRSELGEFELQPVINFAPPTDEGEYPQVVINRQAIVQGHTTREDLKRALHKSISGW